MDPRYIKIYLLAELGKTGLWAVDAKEGGVKLGVICWFGRWRKFAFYPENDTLYEATCLRDIADACEEMTLAQKAKRTGRPT